MLWRPPEEQVIRNAGSDYFAAAAGAAAQSGNDLQAIAGAVKAATGKERRGAIYAVARGPDGARPRPGARAAVESHAAGQGAREIGTLHLIVIL